MKLLSHQNKENKLFVTNHLKDTGMFINEDFCSEILAIITDLWEKVYERRKQGNYVTVIAFYAGNHI